MTFFLRFYFLATFVLFIFMLNYIYFKMNVKQHNTRNRFYKTEERSFYFQHNKRNKKIAVFFYA